MTANAKEGKFIYLMKNSSFFVFNLASDQLLLLVLLTSALNWHFYCVCVCSHLYCSFPASSSVILCAWIFTLPVLFLLFS